MARRWIGVALLAGWLGVSATARADNIRAPPAGAASIPPFYAPGYSEPMPPGDPGPDGCLPTGGAIGSPEALPPNSFSNAHPDLVSPSPRFYVEADYLLWWFRKRQIPPLVSGGNQLDTFPGAAGQPGTTAIVGPGSADTAQTTGGRLSACYWFDQDHTCGVDATGFIFEEREAILRAGGYGNTQAVFARPFNNPNTGLPDADPLVFPDLQGGSLVVSLPRRFMGADANMRFSGCVDVLCFSRVTFLAGARYVYLDEKLLISEGVAQYPDINGFPGDILTLHDNFVTYNRFYGGQLGLETESRVGPMVFVLGGKIAVGQTQQIVKINGDSTVIDPISGTTTDPTRGLLVQPTNIGRYARYHLGVVPEIYANLAWEPNEHLRFVIGYNFLAWSSIVRPGDQIDQTVNVGPVGLAGQLGNSPHPQIDFLTTGFWAQGLSLGLTFSY